MKTNKGTLIVFSGPSGSGKGTILSHYFDKYDDANLVYSVSATTRTPRDGEVEGVNYYFKSCDEFQKMIDNDEFLEWATFCGNNYGTPRKQIELLINEGTDVILEIETVGAFNIKKKCPDAVMVFVLPPSLSELENRLKSRGTENEQSLANRLTVAKKELGLAHDYDYIILNDNIDNAVEDFRSIIDCQRLKTVNNQKNISEVLEK